MKNGAPRDELKNGCGRGWAVPYLSRRTLEGVSTIGDKTITYLTSVPGELF